jgi:hypothetical protein
VSLFIPDLSYHNSKEVRAALAWGSVPYLLIILIQIVLIAIFGRNWFVSSDEWISQEVYYLIFFILLPVGLVLLIWQIVLTIKTVAEAHRFSNWKGLATLILGTLMVVIPIILYAIILRSR